MKTLITMTVSLLGIGMAHGAAGFSNGNDIDITLYSGWVHTRCFNGGIKTRFCQAADYNPGTHDRFVVDGKTRANKVKLTALHEDGSKKTKSSKFDDTKNMSRRINLIASTLLQRPLLEIGTNRVTYQLKDGKRLIKEGEFTSQVEIVGDLDCPDLWQHEYGNACDSPGTACNNYFNHVTGCR